MLKACSEFFKQNSFNKCRFLSLCFPKNHAMFVMSKEEKTLKQISLKKANVITTVLFSVLAATAAMFPLSLFGQGWERNYDLEKNGQNDEGLDLIALPDGGILAVGATNFYSSSDVYVVRVDLEGEVMWNLNIGGQFSQEFGRTVVVEDNGNYIIAGDRYNGNIEKENAYFLRINESGDILNTKELKLPNEELVYDIIQTSEGNLAFIGKTKNPESVLDNTDNVFFGILNANLEEQVMTVIADTLDNEASALIETNDGNLVFIGVSQNPANGDSRDIYLRKIEKSGEPVWADPVYLGGLDSDQGADLVEAPNGDLLICGYTRSQGMGSSDVYIHRLTADGAPVWTEPVIWGGANVDEATTIIQTLDGNFLVAGYTETSSENIDQILIKLDGDGNILWDNIYGDEEMIEQGFSIAESEDGALTVAGLLIKGQSFESDMYLVRTTPDGEFLSNFINGQVRRDENGNCEVDDGELGFQDWIVTASRQSDGRVFIGDTDEEGNYNLRVDTGSYDVQIIPPYNVWEACDPVATVTQTEFFDTTVVNYSIDRVSDCPVMQVDVSTPFLRRCVENRYTVRYCNLGSATAEEARIELVLDDDLELIEVIGGPAPTGTDTLIFELGDVAVQECGRFELLVQHNCSGTLPGQAHCVSARIFPDTFCLPPPMAWDSSSLAVSGRCNGNDLEFVIENVGSKVFEQPTIGKIQYIVIEDDIMLRIDPVSPLQPGEKDTITVPNNQGATYRMLVDQVPDHPGKSNPTVAVEGCVENVGEPFSVGFLTMFREDDGNPFVSVSCEESISSIISNDKRGYPKGYDVEHYIERQTDLKYTVVFHNVGTDTAFYVAIRDTLPAELQPNTFRFLNSSPTEPTSVSWNSDGILKVVFDSIALVPDTSLVEFGHIMFEISQNPSNESGTEIRNCASIFFDFNPPVLTNKTLHTVVDSLEEVIIVSVLPTPPYENNISIRVYPNPLDETATFEILTAPIIPKPVLSQNRFYLFDATGRLVRQQNFGGNSFEFRRNGLPSGAYQFVLQVDGHQVGAGTIVVK